MGPPLQQFWGEVASVNLGNSSFVTLEGVVVRLNEQTAIAYDRFDLSDAEVGFGTTIGFSDVWTLAGAVKFSSTSNFLPESDSLYAGTMTLIGRSRLEKTLSASVRLAICK